MRALTALTVALPANSRFLCGNGDRIAQLGNKKLGFLVAVDARGRGLRETKAGVAGREPPPLSNHFSRLQTLFSAP